MAGDYETFEFLWKGRHINVSFQSNWLGTNQWHIELRCAERLPMTDTGYRSCFVPSDGEATEEEVRGLVTAWLDEAARSPAWRKYTEEGRQLSLF